MADGPLLANILLVDDHPPNLMALEATLAPLGQRLAKASSGEEALKYLLSHECAAILLDVQMPGLDGFETAALIKQRERTRAIPIIFITASSREEANIIRGYSQGVVDYIVKPYDPQILRAKVKVFADLYLHGEALKQREAALHRREREESDAAFRRIMEASLVGVVFTDSEGSVLDANGAFLGMLGYTWEDLGTGRISWNVRAPAEDGAPPWRARQFEKELQRKDGSRLSALLSSTWIEEQTRSVTFVLDIHDFKQAEEELRASEAALRQSEGRERETSERFRALTDSMDQCMWAIRADGTVYYRNRVWLEYSGLRDEAAPERQHLEFVHPVDRVQLESAWDEALRQGTPYEVEYRLRRHDGVYRWFLTRSVPERDSSGRLAGWISTATDIDDRKRDQDALRLLAEASEVLTASLDYEATLQRLATLAVPRLADWCALHMLEADGRIRQVAVAHPDPARVKAAQEESPGESSSSAYSSGLAEVLRTGRSKWTAEIPDELLVASARGNADVLRAWRALGIESCIMVPLLARGRVLGALTMAFAQSGRRYTEKDLELAEDLARRAALSVDNARLYREAQEAVRLRDEFLSIASHELKTPLTPLQLKLAGLLREAEADLQSSLPAARVAAGLEAAHKQIRKLSDLIDDLLDVSRITAGRMHLEVEDVDLCAVTREVVSRFSPQATKADCELEVTAEQPIIGRWDRLRLEQVVTNLLTNAIKYGAGRPIHISVTARGERASLRVKDQGIGIASEYQSRIFDRFERAVSHRHYGGLGLGLYITRQIVEAFEGEIRVSSEPEKGALFEVVLPLRPQIRSGPGQPHLLPSLQ